MMASNFATRAGLALLRRMFTWICMASVAVLAAGLASASDPVTMIGAATLFAALVMLSAVAVQLRCASPGEARAPITHRRMILRRRLTLRYLYVYAWAPAMAITLAVGLLLGSIVVIVLSVSLLIVYVFALVTYIAGTRLVRRP